MRVNVSGFSNTLPQLIQFFSVNTKGICTDAPSDGKVSPAEFSAFWKSLSEDEKEYYKSAAI